MSSSGENVLQSAVTMAVTMAAMIIAVATYVMKTEQALAIHVCTFL